MEDITSFPYLGSILAVDGGTNEDVQVRIVKVAAVFRKMGNLDKCKNNTGNQTTPVQLHCNTNSAVCKQDVEGDSNSIEKLNMFHQQCLRKILKITYLNHITNEEVLCRVNSRRMQAIFAKRRMRFAGHILCLPEQWHAKKVHEKEAPQK